MIDQDLPYLHELESVDSRGSSRDTIVALGISSMLIPMLALFGYGFWRYHRYFEPGQLALFAVIPALLVMVLLRWLFSYSRVATSPDGITLSAALRRRSIPWNSVLRASSKQTSIGRTIITLETNGGRVSLDTGGVSGSMVVSARIAASVWQHLRRNGIANDVSLSERDLSFWQEIGEDVPHDIEWTSGRRRKGPLFEGVTILLFFSVMMAWMLLDDMRLGVFMLLFLAPILAVFPFMMWPETGGKVTGARVTDEAVDIDQPLSTRRIPWDRIVSVDWHRGIALTWNDGSKRRTVTIPYEMGKAESENLMLAVIRNLRRLSDPVALPFPDIVSRNPDSLRKPALTSQRRGMMKTAFINTLEPELARKMTRLYRLSGLSCLLGLVPGMLCIFLDPIGMLSKTLHGSDARFFFTPDTMCVAVPMMLAGIVVFGLLGEWTAGRLAGDNRETWEELKKVAPPSRFETRVNVIMLVLAAGALLLTPLMLDCYWKATDRGIEFSRLWDVRRASYTWSQVKSVDMESYQVNHDGHVCTRERYLISFSNGDTLPLDDSKAVWRNSRQLPDAIDFICRKSGVQMQSR